MSSDGTGVWVYAIVRHESAEARVAGLHGVGREAVRLVQAGDLAAAVGTVALDEFGEDAMRRNLEDLDWLAAKARAHDGVISTIARFGAVIPVRMTTVYLDDDRVRQLLESRRDEFAAALDRVTDREEIGVKAYADPKVLGSSSDRMSERPGGERLSGTAYLLRRRQQLISREDAYRAAAAAADHIHSSLCEHAVDGKRKPVNDQTPAHREGWTVLNGTYLVSRDKVDDFHAAVATLDRETEGIALEVTGPWPPYSFAGDVIGRD